MEKNKFPVSARHRLILQLAINVLSTVNFVKEIFPSGFFELEKFKLLDEIELKPNVRLFYLAAFRSVPTPFQKPVDGKLNKVEC